MRIPDEEKPFCMIIVPISTQYYDIFRLFREELNSLLCCVFIKTDMGIGERGEGTQHTPGNGTIES